MPFIPERIGSMVRMTMADMAGLADDRPGSVRRESGHAISGTISQLGVASPHSRGLAR